MENKHGENRDYMQNKMRKLDPNKIRYALIKYGIGVPIIIYTSIFTNPLLGYGISEWAKLNEKVGEGIGYVLLQKEVYKRSDDDIKKDPEYKRLVKEVRKREKKTLAGLLAGIALFASTMYGINKTQTQHLIKETPQYTVKEVEYYAEGFPTLPKTIKFYKNLIEGVKEKKVVIETQEGTCEMYGDYTRV